MGERYPKVQGRCLACGGEGLFLSASGYVTCTRSECPNPTAVADLLDHHEGREQLVDLHAAEAAAEAEALIRRRAREVCNEENYNAVMQDKIIKRAITKFYVYYQQSAEFENNVTENRPRDITEFTEEDFAGKSA